MRNKRFLATLLLATGGLLVPAHAGVLTYSSSSTWSAGGPVGGTINFSSLSPGNYTSPLTVSPFVFTALIASSIGATNNFGPGTGNFAYTLGSMQLAPTAPGTIYGLGFNLGCYSCSGSSSPSVVVTDANNISYTYTGMLTSGFWGIRSDLALSTVKVSYGTDYVAIDDVIYGGQAQIGGGDPPPTGDTPEAATLILIGTGLGVIARYRRYSGLPSTA